MTTLVNRVIFKSNKNNGLGTSIDIQGNIDILVTLYLHQIVMI